jgi:hypothetical protein
MAGMGATDKRAIGGLLRCCLQSIDEAPDGKEGDVIGCRFHADQAEPQAKFADGAWRWVGPRRGS